MTMEAKFTIEDDTSCVVITLEEARELYNQLKSIFEPDTDNKFTPADPWDNGRFPDLTKGWKDPTLTGPTCASNKTGTFSGKFQECGKHYMHQVCDCDTKE